MIRSRMLFVTALVYGLAFFLFSLGNASAQTTPAATATAVATVAPSAAPTVGPTGAPTVTTKSEEKTETKPAARFSKMYAKFETNLGTFTVLLYHGMTPKTVENFVSLAEGNKEFVDAKLKKKVKRPYFDGLTFHRVIKGFMIQSGDPNGDGTGGPGYTFEDEFHPNLAHTKAGLLSMANYGKDTNGSQFFITLGPQPHLDEENGKPKKKHTIFGEVTEGMDVVNAIGSTKINRLNDKPVEPVVIKKLTIIRK